MRPQRLASDRLAGRWICGRIVTDGCDVTMLLRSRDQPLARRRLTSGPTDRWQSIELRTSRPARRRDVVLISVDGVLRHHATYHERLAIRWRTILR